MADQWFLVPEGRLSWRCLDGEWVVFDSGACVTLALDAVPAAVLGLIETGTHDAADIHAAVSAELSPPEQPGDVGAAQTVVDETLLWLQSRGLIIKRP